MGRRSHGRFPAVHEAPCKPHRHEGHQFRGGELETPLALAADCERMAARLHEKAATFTGGISV
jgi:hypothetical protein